MTQNSHSFRELDIRELLSDEESSISEPHRAFKFLKGNEDLFNSHFCDEDFYVPVKKKSICFEKESSDEEPYFSKPQLSQKEGRNHEKGKEKYIGLLHQNKQIKKAFNKQRKKAEIGASTQNNGTLLLEPKPTQKSQKSVKKQCVLNLLKIKSSEQNIKEIQLILINKKYHIKLNSSLLEINEKSLRLIESQFINRQLCIPIFQYRRHGEWQSSDHLYKFDQDYEPHKLFKCSVTRYFAYLNQHFSSQLLEILIEAQKSKPNEQAGLKSGGLFSFQFFSEAINSLRSYMSSSKLQILQKALLSKSRSLKLARTQAQKQEELKDLFSTLIAEEDFVWKEIQLLELLICFEDTQRYCGKKISESKQNSMKEYWTNYRSVIKKQFEKQLTLVGEVSI